MAKWYGKIGFAELVETSPGVWNEEIIEHAYFGEVYQNTRRLQTPAQLNDNIDISNRISIVADPYANQNFHSMRYVEFMGTKWKVSSVDAAQYPRLILTVGGVYNGQQT